jgi:hypothetical protein
MLLSQLGKTKASWRFRIFQEAAAGEVCVWAAGSSHLFEGPEAFRGRGILQGRKNVGGKRVLFADLSHWNWLMWRMMTYFVYGITCLLAPLVAIGAVVGTLTEDDVWPAIGGMTGCSLWLFSHVLASPLADGRNKYLALDDTCTRN